MWVSLEKMDAQFLDAQLTVEEVLREWPGTFAVFMAAKTQCPGCFMQQFCTLRDVAETYNISLPELMNGLEQCVQS
jgi:hybrid cluster-associated redox disulfide protein